MYNEWCEVTSEQTHYCLLMHFIAVLSKLKLLKKLRKHSNRYSEQPGSNHLWNSDNIRYNGAVARIKSQKCWLVLVNDVYFMVNCDRLCLQYCLQ